MLWSRALFGVCVACNSPTTPGSGPALGVAPGAGLPTSTSGTAKTAEDLVPGMRAPNVRMVLQDGSELQLERLQPQRVVLFFYPMDDTPGCRAEAQGFRDRFSEFRALDTVILGVSLQDAESHRSFIEKERLPFDLAVDDEASAARAFQVPVQGRATARQTFLIDEHGMIARIWRQVSPHTHADVVLAALREHAETSSAPGP